MKSRPREGSLLPDNRLPSIMNNSYYGSQEVHDHLTTETNGHHVLHHGRAAGPKTEIWGTVNCPTPHRCHLCIWIQTPFLVAGQLALGRPMIFLDFAKKNKPKLNLQDVNCMRQKRPQTAKGTGSQNEENRRREVHH